MAFFRCGGGGGSNNKFIASYMASWYSNGTQKTSFAYSYDERIVGVNGGNGNLTSTFTFNKAMKVDAEVSLYCRGSADARGITITKGSTTVFKRTVGSSEPSVNLFPIEMQEGETLSATCTQTTATNNNGITALFFENQKPQKYT